MPRIIATLPFLPPRQPEGHKGTYGRVLVVGGSRGMSGAAVLSGSAALRGGAGLVEVATPAEIQPLVAAGNPCYLTAGLPGDEQGRLRPEAADAVLGLAQKSSVVAIGPGLGQGDGVVRLVRSVVGRLGVPAVVDADGLNALAQLPLDPPAAPLVFTPHPGEFCRLAGVTMDRLRAERERLAAGYAEKRRVVLVLKGHETLVTDGGRLYRNATGNPGMATGGTGDVLTGLVAALMAQKLDAFEAAQLGVYLHGLAGDLARDQRGEVSLIASDLLDCLPGAFQSLRRSSPNDQ